MKKLILLIFIILALPFLSVLTSCDHKTSAWGTMDKADALMNSQPDSAYSILLSIDKNKLGDDDEKARYALLMSMALDKNYIDTTTFDVLQPAIDYYLRKGNANERLKTLYYQGCIFLNQGDFDQAMECYLKAEDLRSKCNDTIIYANMLVAQGNIYAKSCQMEDYVKNNLEASELYNKVGEQHRELSSLLRVLDGYISMGNKGKSDSIKLRIDSIIELHPEMKKALEGTNITYCIRFNSESDIRNIVGTLSDFTQYDEDTKLDIALGYLKLNKPEKAKIVFESIDTTTPKTKSIRFLAIKPDILEANHKYKEALRAYKDFHSTVELENNKIYSQKTIVAEELHKLKLNHLYSLQSKDKQIWLGLCLSLVLIIIIGFIYYQYRIGRTKRVLSEKEQSRLQLENENLHAKNKVLELEKHTSILEREKQNLVSENMALRISQLESESESLRDLLKKAELSKPILDAIQERVEMLNGVFAAHITSDENFSKPYDKWISEVTADKDKFINSTRLAFRASHPKFMSYLDSKGLTESELNYVCLYALGLRGKDIGEYIQMKRHYHISSDVRKKLGLKDSDTNLGLYVRKLMKDL
ncbi:MAG: hypothetical protein NC453_27100 [Muribaculum sp.]|nr:hypothetical protein [Muribaculum sp.]